MRRLEKRLQGSGKFAVRVAAAEVFRVNLSAPERWRIPVFLL